MRALLIFEKIKARVINADNKITLYGEGALSTRIARINRVTFFRH
jgi:hypothetical protein